MSAIKPRGKPWIYIRNKSEPKTDPCGTPAYTFFQLDESPYIESPKVESVEGVKCNGSDWLFYKQF